MDEYDTLEKVQALFNGMTPGEEWEGFFLGTTQMQDGYLRTNHMQGGYLGGQSAPILMVLFAVGKNGIAFFHVTKRPLLSLNRRDRYVEKDKYTYVPNNMIDKAKAKKFLINSNVMLKMRLVNNQIFDLIVLKEKDLPYQEAGKKALLNRFGK